MNYRDCDHIFVKIREGEYYYGFHSSDCEYTPSTVVCVKCGLTNEHIIMDPILRKHTDLFNSYLNPYYKKNIELNDIEFKRQFSHGYLRSGKYFNESVFKYMSSKVVPSKHVTELYKLAYYINPNGSNEELFEIMQKLHEIETPEERFRLINSEELLNRYMDRVKVLKYEKK